MALAMLALSLSALLVVAARTQETTYQGKFKSDDWSDAEILKPGQSQTKSAKSVPVNGFGNPLDSRASYTSSANSANSSNLNLAPAIDLTFVRAEHGGNNLLA